MKIIEFEIPGGIKAKQRTRSTKSGHHFTPKETIISEAFIREHFVGLFPKHRPLRGPLSVEIEFHRSPPKSMPKWKRAAAEAGLWYDDVGSDVDNKAKTVLDSLNKVAYLDDRQICTLVCRKLFAEREYVYVRIHEYQQPERPMKPGERKPNPAETAQKLDLRSFEDIKRLVPRMEGG